MVRRVLVSILLVAWWFGSARSDEQTPPTSPPPSNVPPAEAPRPDAPADDEPADEQPAPKPPPPEQPAPEPPMPDAAKRDASPPTPQPSVPPTTPSTRPAPVSPAPATGTGPTIITGRVIDVLGRNVSGVRVYVLPRRGKPLRTKTAADGRYRIEVARPGTYGVVIAIGKAHVYRTVIAKQGATNTLDIEAELDVQGGEVIKIEDRKRPKPKVAPKAKHDTQRSLPYTEEAIERDAWARAWLLLDVDETGRVVRLKLLKKPGFGLEKICLEEAFKLRFEPAKDAAGRPMKNYMLWTMEWPSWGWLVQGNGTAIRRPPDHRDLHVYTQNVRAPPGREYVRVVDADGSSIVPVSSLPPGSVAPGKTLKEGAGALPLPTAGAFPQALGRVPCAGSGPLNLDLRNRAYRDCSKPDLSLAVTLPWITQDTIATALQEIEGPDMILVEHPAEGSRLYGYVGVGVTATLGIAAIASLVQYDRYDTRVADHGNYFTTDRRLVQRDKDRRDRWKSIGIGMTAATLLVGGATLFLWNRSEPSFSLQPASSGTGGSATYTTSF